MAPRRLTRSIPPHRRPRFHDLLAASLGLWALALLPFSSAAPSPNVLLIIADDLTAEALACYGNPQCLTPHADRLAREGTLFHRAYSQYPVCGPSRAALMASLYPQAIGVTTNGAATRFTDNLRHLPSLTQHFKNHGYHSARVSKIYHMRVPGDITAGVDGPDHAPSWSERHNCQAPEWMTPGIHRHLTNESLMRDPQRHYGLGFGTAFYVVESSPDSVADQPDAQAATKAIEIMEKSRDQPFFLAVGLVRPHVPLVAPSPFFQAYPQANLELPFRSSDDWADIPEAGISKNSRSSGLADDPEAQRAVLRGYYASVSFMDAQVGRLLAALETLDLRKRTVVVFTSDHGYHLGEHDFWQKMSLHEEAVRIPLIVSVPGKPAAATDALVEQIDLYPTLCALTGLPIPPHCQGRSAAGLFDKPENTHRDAVYALRGQAHLLRTDRHAYLVYPDGSEELYDMHQDPGQFRNLAAADPPPAALSTLRQNLAATRKSIKETAPPWMRESIAP